MSLFRLLSVAVGCACLSACLSLTSESSQPAQVSAGTTLGDMTFEPVEIQVKAAEQADLGTLKARYSRLLAQIDAPDIRQQIQYRLADLNMALAEQANEAGDQPQMAAQHFDDAIQAYQALLLQPETDAAEQSPANADVIYQLSRAYDLQGQSKQSVETLQQMLTTFPEHPQRLEAWFRIGESHFSQRRFKQAIEAYSVVANDPLPAGQDNPFKVISAYMMGWSYFKLDQQGDALYAFTHMLDNALPNEPTSDYVSLIEQLPVGQKRLVNDTLRIMAMLFSYAGNAEAIIDFYRQHGERAYEQLIYAQLAQQHLNNDRYRDSADVYLAFANEYPTHPGAMAFFIKHIDAFILGDFPSQVLPAKQQFVEIYGINSPHWDAIDQRQARTYLKPYLRELAQFQHSLAQALTKQGGESPSDKARTARIQAYASAARWYREYLDTFNNDPADAIMRFYLAESLDEAGDYQAAIEQYTQFAYQNPEHIRAADAAYSAILAITPLLNIQAPQQALLAQQRQLQQEFVSVFSDDGRAIAVVRQMMQQDFDGEVYGQALVWSRWLQNKVTDDLPLLLSAKLVEAHSVFAQQDYQTAERLYTGLINWLQQGPSSEHSRIPALTDKLAASLYKQAELKLAEQDTEGAVEVLARLIKTTPHSDIRRLAQFDMATHLLTLQSWQRAIDTLLDFQFRFTGDVLLKDIPEKLLYAYEQDENWQAAADILYKRWQSAPDAQNSGQELLLAASYYNKIGNRDQALPAYRTYAHRYPLPFDDVTEARFIMSEFYRDSGEDSKRRFWLKKLINGDLHAGSDRTDRSRYLAAMSASVFADDAGYQFKRIKLTAPLSKSLAKKQQAMQRAIAAYDKVMAYGIEEFSTSAHFRLGQLYERLAGDLMASSRPKNLNELELEQYELLLEEQAFPFEERAIELHLSNSQRSWQGIYNQWVKKSFDSLASMSPGRYAKLEEFEELSFEQQ